MTLRRTIWNACAALAVTLSLSVTAAAGESGTGSGTDRQRNSLECIFFRSIYDWRAIDRSNLIVWAPSRRSPYHVRLATPCDGLRFTDTIAFSSNLDGRLCAFGGDAIVVDHQRCPIGSITKLSQDELNDLLARTRGQKKKDK